MTVDFRLNNSENLVKLFEQLSLFEQNSLVNQSLAEASKPILEQAKSNLLARLKGNYNSSRFNKSFVANKMKNKAGMIIGIDNYKYRWLEWGTRLRQTGGKVRNGAFKAKINKDKSKAKSYNRGKVVATHFFFDAVKSQQEQAASILSKGIINSMQRILEKNQS